MEKKKFADIHMTARQRNDRIFAGALLLPSVLITVIFILIPVVDSVIKSFLDYRVRNIISGTPGEWNNFENYIRLFNNGRLGMSIVHTLTFVVGVVVAQFLIGMALALILNSNIKFTLHRYAGNCHCRALEADPAYNAPFGIRPDQCLGGSAGGSYD